MVEITKADWKLFREKIVGWQEAYMARLNREYMELLSADGDASAKFWALEERIRIDKKQPGVQLELKKSHVGWDLVRLLNDGVITAADLEGFRQELREDVLHMAEVFRES